MKTLTDSIELRAARILAYRKDKYVLDVPPVSATTWSEEAWCNWVRFHDSELTGFLPYNTTKHREACVRAYQ